VKLNTNFVLAAERVVIGTLSWSRWKLRTNIASMTEGIALVIRAGHFVVSTGGPFVYARLVRPHTTIAVTIGAAFGAFCRAIALLKLAITLVLTKESTRTRRGFITFDATL
jgi:hypothetical protein